VGACAEDMAAIRWCWCCVVVWYLGFGEWALSLCEMELATMETQSELVAKATRTMTSH
jgi:hypothetical protein